MIGRLRLRALESGWGAVGSLERGNVERGRRKLSLAINVRGQVERAGEMRAPGGAAGMRL